MEQIKWHLRFIELAKLVASWSKDRSTKVGAVAVGPYREICSVGYNGMPRGVNDDVEARHQRPEKYSYFEHAERNLLFNASRIGARLQNCTIYITHYPCADCARGIIQSEFKALYYQEDTSNEAIAFRARIGESHLISFEMLSEVGIKSYIIRESGRIDIVNERDLVP